MINKTEKVLAATLHASPGPGGQYVYFFNTERPSLWVSVETSADSVLKNLQFISYRLEIFDVYAALYTTSDKATDTASNITGIYPMKCFFMRF